MKWIQRKWNFLRYKFLLRSMIRAMIRENWDSEDICTVLLKIGGEIDVLTPSVKERLGLPA
ncbi:MAG: hypothetical protein ACLQVL_36820 [Terriglobia bacterium]